jgi:O-antigen ligase
VGTRRGHSLYLEELADTGIMGMLGFLSIALFCLRELALARRAALAVHAPHAHLISALFLAVVTYLASAMFLHLSYQRYYWLLLGMAGAAVNIYRHQVLPLRLRVHIAQPLRAGQSKA